MTDGQEVVIVGADGTEHVFPPGMDPVKAAAIVRGQASTLTRTPGELGRKDVGAVSVDQNWISDHASKLPRPMQYPAAFIGSLLGTMLEGASQPESIATGIATAGAGRLPNARPNYEGAGSGLLENVNAIGRTLEGTPSIPGHPGAGTIARLTGRVLQKVEPGKASGYDRYMPNIGSEMSSVESFAPPISYAAPTEAFSKPAYSAMDVVRIKDLMKQGVSQDMAVKIVQDLKDRGNDAFNRR